MLVNSAIFNIGSFDRYQVQELQYWRLSIYFIGWATDGGYLMKNE